MSHIPEDRNKAGLVGNMSVSDNLVLKSTGESRFSGGKGLFLKKRAIRDYAREGAEPEQVSGTFMEAVYIHRRDGYYYMFGSAGSCCEGEKSTYHVTVGRSESFFGPYVDKQGRQLLDNHYETLLSRSERCIGPGHNAEIFTDDEGSDWILYHGFKSERPQDGRVVWLDRVEWIDGWPHIATGRPSVISARPVFRSQ